VKPYRQERAVLRRIESHAARIGHLLGRRATFGGQSFRMPGYYASRLPGADDAHEAYMVAVLRRRLEASPGVFVDIGVNIGQTLAKVLGIDRNRAYLGFEPQISCCYNVDQFLRLNELHNARVLPIALSDCNRMLAFYAQGEFDEMAGLIAASGGATGARRAHFVPARIGDEALRELGVGDICAIKIDVEGAELPVMRGLRETLRVRRPSVIFEVLPNFHGRAERVMHPPSECARNQASADAICALLGAVGYDIFQIDDRGGETRIDRFELNDRDNHVGNNYIAHPRGPA
jgi:FkbM family methyltransferase